MPGSRSARRRVYWDACVFLSYVEGDQDRVAEIEDFLRRARAGELEIITSTLSIVEVAFAAGEKASAALSQEIEEAIDALWAPGGGVVLAEFYPLIAKDARGLMRLALTRGWSLKPPDAIHLATASRVGAAAVHTYDGTWSRYRGDIGCPIGRPEAPQPPLPFPS